MSGRLARVLAAAAIASAALAVFVAPSAEASFGLKDLQLSLSPAGGAAPMQAGSHPAALNNVLKVNTEPNAALGHEVPQGALREVAVTAPAGLVGSPTAVPTCSSAAFLSKTGSGECPDAAALGIITTSVEQPGPKGEFTAPVYNLTPPPGVAAEIGFWTLIVPFTIDFRISPEPPYNVVATAANVPSFTPFYGSNLTLWGDPASPEHNSERGRCAISAGSCPVSNVLAGKPFLTLPTRCMGPLATRFDARSWEGALFSETIFTNDGLTPPDPLGVNGCTDVQFKPRISAQPSAHAAEAPSGLSFDLNIDSEGLTNPTGIAQSEIEKAVVTLPAGVTVSPSQAAGLGACTERQLAGETFDSEPGAGCPQSSKVGEVEVETPLLEGERLQGSIFVAKPYENRFGSLIALYMTIKDPRRGISVKLEGKVEPDLRTGQLVATFEELPQLPFSSFRFHFREGPRAPLVMPASCGEYQTRAVFTPYANPAAPYVASSSFTIDSGVNGGPCPVAGQQPFSPSFQAGTSNNAAGRYAPFAMRMTRQDGEQDITRFSSVLPPGLTGKLAGVAKCPQAAVVAAKATTGFAQLASPSCPASSRIGSLLTGAGVGSAFTYVPGSLYLGGPYHGDPLSVIAIVPAVAGPFDLGTVVIQEALTLNPVTAEVEVDGGSSDPIPRILAGIPLRVRDIRAIIDRPQFTLNPTSCEPFSTRAMLWGIAAPVGRAARFQAASCQGLGFKPRLTIRLSGGTARGRYPALKAVLRPRPGDANVGRASVALPHSAFLKQEHIRTVCTRVQFRADGGNGGGCPPGSVYGYAKAWTPLLEEPLEGPVYLGTGYGHELPDLVVALHGIVDVDLNARIDSLHGGIRSTFETVPDTPVSRFVLEMKGGKKGLIVNSTNICHGRHRGTVRLTGQNGVRDDSRPLVRARCHKTKRRQRRSHRARR